MPAAGYVFAINATTDAPIEEALELGVFGTWSTRADDGMSVVGRATMGTLTDYLSMRPGEWVTFFRDRELKGVGRLIRFPGVPTVALENWQGASMVTALPTPPYLLPRATGQLPIPWLVPFQPVPASLRRGVDMDVVLSGDASRSLRALPRFSGLSFLKVEPNEAEAIVNAILRANGVRLEAEWDPPHTDWQQRVLGTARPVDTDALLVPSTIGIEEAPRRGEDALHAWLVDQLARATQAVEPLGPTWEYVVPQEPASPMKPRVYCEFIDVFGYQASVRGPGLQPTIDKYKIIELKAHLAGRPELDQVLKYADYIAVDRAGGDYEMVDAFLIAPEFRPTMLGAFAERGRPFFRPRGRSQTSRRWAGLRLIQLGFTANGLPQLTDVTPALPDIR